MSNSIDLLLVSDRVGAGTDRYGCDTGLRPFAEPVTTTDEEVLTSHIPALSA
ncbi:MAG TPA: hypothetical protein VEY14_01815 [Nocardioidaceae bacterium]|nr:hypothetical protein [Nocardioidaceae bacterium]